ncbi:MAG: OmpA family protein [Desulfobacterales bacterium]|nr:OmpA family protein [Desulfobacterales bacterium]
MLLPEDLRKRRRIWMTGLSALLAVAAACVWTTAGRIPQEIADRATAALRIAGIAPRVEVAVDGRTLTLSGALTDPYTRARALAVAGSIRGVRGVVDRIGLAEAAPAKRSDPIRSDAPMVPPTAGPADPPATGPSPDTRRATESAATSPNGAQTSASAHSAGAMETGAPRPTNDAGAPPPSTRATEASTTASPASAGAIPAPADTPRPAAPVLNFPVLRFGFDSTQVTQESEPLLEEAIALLKSHPGLRVELSGHTDSSGARSYNQRLSQRRAEAIAKRMIAAGVDAAQLQTRGHGEMQPRAENRSRQGRSLNRRVEMTAIP